MPKKYSYLAVALLSTFSFLACNKDDKDYKNAIVSGGDVSSQGCGYLLQFEDGSLEKPYQLLSAFQHNGMRVKVKYHVSDVSDTCGTSAPYSYYQLIIIDDIKRGEQVQP